MFGIECKHRATAGNRQRILARLSLVAVLLSLCLVVMAAPSRSAAGQDSPLAVRLSAEAYASVRAALAELGLSTILDYGEFVWLETTTAGLPAIEAAGVSVSDPPAADSSAEVYRDPFVLHLGGRAFDPLRDGTPQSAGRSAAGSDGADLHLVQFVGPIRSAWLTALQEEGLEIVQYIPPFAYVVWGEATTLARAAATGDEVRWSGPFAPAYRVLPRWQSLSGEPLVANVLIYRGAGVAGVLERLAALGAKVEGQATIGESFALATMDLAGSALQDAARVPGVYSIQPVPLDGGLRGEMSDQVNAGNMDGSQMAFPGYGDWLASLDLDGAGVVVADVDAGVQDSHPDLAGRLLPCTGDTCGLGASSDHGTHTAGIMAADGASGETDGGGFLHGLGMAPGAGLVEQLYSPWYLQAGGMQLLMADSWRNGAAVSGNSWGPASTPQGYDVYALQVDVGVRDADPDTAGNQPLSYVLSVENGRGGYQTQGSPDEAKNILSVGSTRMQRDDGSQIADIDDLSANTAHGPALDGRNLPLLVAPGCSVDSTVRNGYDVVCGTSMASPHVTGAVALFVQYYRRRAGVDPSPALVKAAFLPVAHDLAGHHDADGGILGHPFDSKQGWGRLDAAAVLDPQAPVIYADAPVILGETGDVWQKWLGAADPERPVRIMLAWTDAPGHGLGGDTPAWNNDLDLVVEAGGQIYRGNAFGPDGWSVPGGGADGKNNTEGVFLAPGTASQIRVRVVAANLTSDGVPGQGDITDQDFALACYNCRSQPDFALVADPDHFDICAPGSATGAIRVERILGFEQPVALVATDPQDGWAVTFAPAEVTPPGQSQLTLQVADVAVAGDHRLVVVGTSQVTQVHTTTLSLRIDPAPPARPVLLSPDDGALNLMPGNVQLAWQGLLDAASYGLQIDTDPGFSAPLVARAGLVDSSYLPGAQLALNTCYFWRVRADNACGSGDWSPAARFGTAWQVIVLGDGAEEGGGNWTTDGLWHISSAPDDPCAMAHQGSRSWYYGQEPACDYDVGANSGSLTLA
ncbi:MAG: S8 family serine peptidase, partial [Anaerolineae bacterium]